MQYSDFVTEMTEKAQKVQAVVSKIHTFEAACRYAVDLTLRQGGQTVAAPSLGVTQQAILIKKCTSAGLRVLSASIRTHAENIHTALTYADWGVAETGTLVLDSRSENLRLATMLSETHIVILPVDRIRPDSEALGGELDRRLQSDSPSYTAFITGASRTADIERVLAIGVHGPQELHILILEENPE